MKDLISITEISPTVSSIKFVINSVISLNQNDIFLYYNNTKMTSSDYSFTSSSASSTTKCEIIPNTPFSENGYATLFIQNENIFSNTIFSYFSFSTIIDSNNNPFTTLTAHLPAEMVSSSYKLDTFIPYMLNELFPPTIINIINSIDPINSIITVDTTHEDYDVYTLILIDNSSTPLPDDNYSVKFYFEGDELLI